MKIKIFFNSWDNSFVCSNFDKLNTLPKELVEDFFQAIEGDGKDIKDTLLYKRIMDANVIFKKPHSMVILIDAKEIAEYPWLSYHQQFKTAEQRLLTQWLIAVLKDKKGNTSITSRVKNTAFGNN